MYDPTTRVREILKQKRGGITRAPMPPGAPAWDDILDMAWDEKIEEGAREGRAGFRTIRKLLTDSRFNR